MLTWGSSANVREALAHLGGVARFPRLQTSSQGDGIIIQSVSLVGASDDAMNLEGSVCILIAAIGHQQFAQRHRKI